MSTVIYVRQSLDRDGSGAAVERQLEDCRALASRQGLSVTAEFVDNDVSASKGVRPGFALLLDAIRAGDVQTIIVWHTDRLYRRVRDLVDIVETAERHALKVLTVRAGDLDLSTPAGRMLAGMLGHAARYEVEQKGARQVAANVQRARAGHWQFSNRPYGYQRIDGNIVQVPAEAEALREAYRRFTAGDTYYGIAEDFNARGIPTVSGGTWTMTQLRERLRNPRYAGIVIYKGDAVTDAIPSWGPIIGADDWEQYEAASRRRKGRHDWSNRTKYLLSGIAVCGVCGGRMLARPEYRAATATRPRRTQMTYQCTANWCTGRLLEPVDNRVEAAIIARLSMPDALDLVRPPVDLTPLRVEADALRDRRDELAALLADGVLTASAVRDASADLTARLEKIAAKIAAHEGDLPMTALVSAPDLTKHWREVLTLDQRRRLIRRLVTVTIDKQPSRIFDPALVRVEWNQ